MSREAAFAGDAQHEDTPWWRSGNVLTRTTALSGTMDRRPVRRELCLTPGIEVPRQRVLKKLGLRDRKAPVRLARQIEQAIESVIEEGTPRCLCRAYTLETENGRVRIGADVELDSRALAVGMGWCRLAFAYVATLGAGVDRVVREAMDTRPAYGMVLDTVASVAAEVLVDEIEQTLSRRLLPDEALSLPFSPGYCDWPVREQTKLFSLLPDKPAGVTLSDSWLMTPRKSITGILGIGPADRLEETRNPCAVCSKKDCQHKRYRGRRRS